MLRVVTSDREIMREAIAAEIARASVGTIYNADAETLAALAAGLATRGLALILAGTGASVVCHASGTDAARARARDRAARGLR